jgi:hypothetical protein
MTAAFMAPYTALPGMPRMPSTEDTFKMAPCRRDTIPGSSAWVTARTCLKFRL